MKQIKEPLQLIERLNRSDPHINRLYSRGSCYQFSLLLQTFYPEGSIYIRKDKKHTALMIKEELYDVSGKIVQLDDFTPITPKEIAKCEFWSSERNLIMLEKKLFKKIESKLNEAKHVIYVAYTIGQLAALLLIFFAITYLNFPNKPEFKWFVVSLIALTVVWMHQLKKQQLNS